MWVLFGYGAVCQLVNFNVAAVMLNRRMMQSKCPRPFIFRDWLPVKASLCEGEGNCEALKAQHKSSPVHHSLLRLLMILGREPDKRQTWNNTTAAFYMDNVTDSTCFYVRMMFDPKHKSMNSGAACCGASNLPEIILYFFWLVTSMGKNDEHRQNHVFNAAACIPTLVLLSSAGWNN